MANIRQVKRRINSAQNISKITGAMEMVAASKMKKAQDQALKARPFSLALVNSLKKIVRTIDPSLHPLLSNHNQGYPILLIISTDKGLCGGLNTNIFKTVLNWKKHHTHAKYVVIGKKAVMFARLAQIDILAEFTDLPENVTLESILPITELVKEEFLSKKAQRVDIVFTDFINTLSQKTSMTTLLPIKEDASGNISDEEALRNVSYQFEPNAKTLLDELLPYYLENTLYHVFLEARASEQSARMVAMKNASENAHDLVQELQLVFNKSRQASITNELLDMTTATMSIS